MSHHPRPKPRMDVFPTVRYEAKQGVDFSVKNVPGGPVIFGPVIFGPVMIEDATGKALPRLSLIHRKKHFQTLRIHSGKNRSSKLSVKSAHVLKAHLTRSWIRAKLKFMQHH